MAKRRQTAPPTQGGDSKLPLILTLVFFIMATFILGAVAYFGFEKQAELEKAAKDAKSKADGDRKQMDEAKTRMLILRQALGIKEGSDEAAALVPTNKEKALEEYNLIRARLQQVGFGTADSAPLVMTDAEGAAVPAQPTKRKMAVQFNTEAGEGIVTGFDSSKTDILLTMSGLVTEIEQKERDFKTKIDEKDKDLAAANNAKDLAEKAKDAADKARNDAITEKTKAENELSTAQKQVSDLQAQVTTLTNNLAKEKALLAKAKENVNDELLDKIKNLQDQFDRFRRKNKLLELIDLEVLINYRDALGRPLIRQDLSALGKPKGKITLRDRDEPGQPGLLRIDRGSSDGLKALMQFAVFPGNVVIQGGPNEKNLKGRIEVVQVLNANSATCRILEEFDPVRNPIVAGDTLLNPLWEPGVPMRVAIGGRIDFDGDGYADNEAFIRSLQRQGVIVDAYLDMKDLEIRGQMQYSTLYLVMEDLRNEAFGLKSNDPRSEVRLLYTERQAEMRKMAQEFGVQPVSPEKFLVMLGYPVPKNPVPMKDELIVKVKKPMQEGTEEPK